MRKNVDDSMIIDTHVHYFNPKNKECWAANRMAEFEARGIKFVEISIDCFDIDNMAAVITKYSSCLGVVLGEHPKQVTADLDIEKVFVHVRERLEIYKDHALGIKTGLDYYRVEDDRARWKQRKLLRMFLECAKDEKLPVILHVRSHEDKSADADKDMLSVLSETQFKGKMVLHCFSGDRELASRYLAGNENTYFGIGGVLTYPDCSGLTEAIKEIPRDRILLETDGPYMKPFYPDGTRTAGKKNSSLHLPVIIDKIAAVLGISPKEVEDLTTKNACEFYGG